MPTKPTMQKIFKRRGRHRGGKYDQSILYACMKISQQNPDIVQLICTNKNVGKKKWKINTTMKI
jgi:hypothetical protein